MSLTMACPESMRRHATKVLVGEYDIAGLEFDKPPVILDVGANVGAFALWALQRWPGSFVHCYEPHPDTVRVLARNLSKDVPRGKLVETPEVLRHLPKLPPGRASR